jgi:hypothetical protein
MSMPDDLHETRHARFVYDHLRRHTPQLEQVDFLPVQLEHAGFRVRQANEGQVMLLPISCKGFGVFRANNDHLSLTFDEVLIVLAQLRHVPLAEWSGKAAVENQQHVRFAAKIGQANRLTLEILQSEIWGRGVKRDLGHGMPFREIVYTKILTYE